MGTNRDDSMGEKAREFLQRLDALDQRDAVDEQVARLSTPEAQERQFQRILRELRKDEGESSNSDAAPTPTPDDGNITSFDAFRDAQAARQAAAGEQREVANDFAYDDYYQMAASGGEDVAGWQEIDLRLRLPDRVLPVFANPGENDSVFVRSDDCAADWHSLTLGGFPYELAQNASDPAWVAIDGCTESALRSLANDGQDIDANPN